jgi:hisG: ATP phosphoribosyltransferase
MLRIAVQSKGRLFEETMALLQEADIKISTSKRILLVQSSNFPIEVLFLRDDDIPQSVAGGVADLGIVGENEFVERKEDAEVIKRLGSASAVCHWLYLKMWTIRVCLGLKDVRLRLLIPAF